MTEDRQDVVTLWRCADHGILSGRNAEPLGSGSGGRLCPWYVTNSQCRRPVEPVEFVPRSSVDGGRGPGLTLSRKEVEALVEAAEWCFQAADDGEDALLDVLYAAAERIKPLLNREEEAA